MPDSTAASAKEIVAVLDLPGITLEEAQEALLVLRAWKSSEVDALLKKAAGKWPKASVFSASA